MRFADSNGLRGWPMCGIVGILGKEAVATQVVEALRRLEYRGYDSAGVATLEDVDKRQTLYVLSIDAPGGSETSVKIIPRSSFGINPFGIVEFDHQKNNPPNAKMIKVCLLYTSRCV